MRRTRISIGICRPLLFCSPEKTPVCRDALVNFALNRIDCKQKGLKNILPFGKIIKFVAPRKKSARAATNGGKRIEPQIP